MWPVPATRTPAPTTAVGSPPILVVGATKDPATPYVWAQRLAAELQHGELVTWQGENHVAYYYSGCVRALDQAYFVAGTLPAPARCVATEGRGPRPTTQPRAAHPRLGGLAHDMVGVAEVTSSPDLSSIAFRGDTVGTELTGVDAVAAQAAPPRPPGTAGCGPARGGASRFPSGSSAWWWAV